jgi:nitrite reductase/ring-hydroxylating ferredoxin subunit
VEPHLSRRQLVVVAGAGAGALAVAACSGGSSGSDTSGGTGGGSGAGGAGGGGGGGGGGSGSGGALATLADVPVGSAVAAKDADGRPIVVAQPSAGKVVAFSAICTHMGCTVAPAGKQLNCPCHGSQYDAFTGAVLRGPAPKPLPAVPVHVANGEVLPGTA